MKILKRFITGIILFSFLLFAIFEGGFLFNISIFLVSLINLYEINNIKGHGLSSFSNIFILTIYSILFLGLFTPFSVIILNNIILKVCFFALLTL